MRPEKIKDKNFKKLCEVLLAEMKHIKAPGASIGVWNQNKEQTAGFGITSNENRLPLTLLEAPTNGLSALTGQY